MNLSYTHEVRNGVGRRNEVTRLLSCLHAGKSCAVVGVSNMGKSTLLRMLHERGNQLGHAVLVYVDANRMLDRTEQAFYELVLRCILEDLPAAGDLKPIFNEVSEAYGKVTDPSSEFQVALGFIQGITAVIEGLDRLLVVLLDEFDEPLRELDGRVLLNLRALRDRYPAGLSYVVATDRPIREMRQDAAVDEFSELVEHDTLYLAPLTDDETGIYTLYLAEREGVSFDEQDVQFVQIKSGGHPGLVEAVCNLLGEVTGPSLRSPAQDWIIHREVSGRLRDDGPVQAECMKLWMDLNVEEQEALFALLSPQETPAPELVQSLQNKHVLRSEDDGVQFFSELFEEYVRRQRALRRGTMRGLRLDLDSGEVWVEERPIPPLTQLEHRLLVLMYGRLGKIVDKYQIVEAVWGADYIEDVDDARIEKLISRLRQKLEPDSSNPRYLLTVRGRGHKLVDQ